MPRMDSSRIRARATDRFWPSLLERNRAMASYTARLWLIVFEMATIAGRTVSYASCMSSLYLTLVRCVTDPMTASRRCSIRSSGSITPSQVGARSASSASNSVRTVSTNEVTPGSTSEAVMPAQIGKCVIGPLVVVCSRRASGDSRASVLIHAGYLRYPSGIWPSDRLTSDSPCAGCATNQAHRRLARPECADDEVSYAARPLVQAANRSA